MRTHSVNICNALICQYILGVEKINESVKYMTRENG